MRATAWCIPFIILVVALFSACPGMLCAQSAWARTIGGDADEYFDDVTATSDGGFIIAGGTQSFGSGMYDAWIVKLDGSGNVQWQKTYGGAANDSVHAIREMPDGGYAVVGETGGIPYDLLVLKLDSSGAVEWQKSFGGADTEYGADVQPTSDGGMIIAGSTYSFGGGLTDGWIVKLDSSGDVEWEKTYGTAGYEFLNVIQETPGGGYVVCGETDFSGAYDLWVFKIDSLGTIQWQQTYGVPGSDFAESIRETSDSGFVVVGSAKVDGVDDLVVLKLDSTGGLQWQRTYGREDPDFGASVEETSDGGYAVAGGTYSYGAGSEDIWLLKLDGLGHIEWQKTYGGASDDSALSFTLSADGGFLIVGRTDSFGAGGSDGWILKLAPDGTVAADCTLESDSVANPVTSALTPSDGPAAEADTAATVTTLTNDMADSSAEIQEQCESPCLFCDEFDDDQLAPDWTYARPSWSESAGDLIGTASKKALAIASPAFAGCTDCSFESSIMTAGGPDNRVSFFAWYADKHNNVEVLFKEERDKVIIKQRSGTNMLTKTKVDLEIVPGVYYDVRLTFDGAQFTVLVDGSPVASFAASATPFGTAAFQAKGTAHFGRVSVQ